MLVDDFVPMLAFYRDVLGFKVVVDIRDTYVELDTGAARIGLCARTLMESVVGAPMRGDAGADAVLQFGVADLAAAAGLLRERGITLATEPHDQAAWGLRIFHVRDPAGRLLEMTVPLAATTR
jgi:catechol 2,3-dioxygenase-like lactoylglutathione lyase family enzyme